MPPGEDQCHEPAGSALRWQLQRGEVALGSMIELPELDSDLLRLGKEGVVGAIGERTPAAIESPGVELGGLEEALLEDHVIAEEPVTHGGSSRAGGGLDFWGWGGLATVPRSDEEPQRPGRENDGRPRASGSTRVARRCQ
jgi:hypothetical protein